MAFRRVAAACARAKFWVEGFGGVGGKNIRSSVCIAIFGGTGQQLVVLMSKADLLGHHFTASPLQEILEYNYR